MKKIIIKTPGSLSAILVGARWEAVTRLLPEKGVTIVTDKNVFSHYGSRFPDFPVLKLQPGEESKQMKVIENLSVRLLKTGIDRSGFILAIGGGVVCDAAGFLASVYMRGIRCGYVSTSLLSQVDASTGGKTGINVDVVKNAIGTFRQPEFVICDTTMLRTLPDDEYLSGLAELIKTGIIGDRRIIEILETRYPQVISRDRELLSELVFRSVKFKASVVARDEKESGLRQILNFGHTFGHAFELYTGIKHGFAVAAGIRLAALFSLTKGYIIREEYRRINNLLVKYGFKTGSGMPADKVRKLISSDKKKRGDEISFVFIRGLGKPVIEKLRLSEVIDFYRQFGKRK